MNGSLQGSCCLQTSHFIAILCFVFLPCTGGQLEHIPSLAKLMVSFLIKQMKYYPYFLMIYTMHAISWPARGLLPLYTKANWLYYTVHY